MSANDYIAKVKANVKNRKLFSAKQITLTPESLENLLRMTFEAGVAAGQSEPSLFERIFGK